MTTTIAAPSRVASIDLIRGIVMVLMAIDHVRVYSGVPAGGPDPGVFFTRWVTHFCAPVFAFYAGTSAFLHGRKLSQADLSRFLLTRGLILIALEFTIIKFCWTFRLDYSFTLAGVIWMLGASMVLLAGMVRVLSAKAIGIAGLAIVAFQQIFGQIPGFFPKEAQEAIGWVWEFVYPAGLNAPPGVAVLYVIVPWIGVMAAGYGFGVITTWEDRARRREAFLRIGIGATALFLIVATTLAITKKPSNASPIFFQLLNQQKYPASQLYLLMTLGPAIACMGLVANTRLDGALARVLTTFGRVPMFYYLLHIPLIHLLSIAASWIVFGISSPEWYAQAPFTRIPAEYRWNLPLLYLVFFVAVAILYVPCRWMAGYKQHSGRGKWWSSIL